MATKTIQRQEARRLEIQARANKLSRRAITYGLMILLALFFVFPILFMIVASLKPADRVLADLGNLRLALLPDFSSLSLENYNTIFAHQQIDFVQFAANSTFLTFVAVVCGLFINSMAAFVLARLRWFGRSITVSIVIALLIIPLEAIAIPLMIQVNEMAVIPNLIIAAILLLCTVLIWRIVTSIVQDRLPGRPGHSHRFRLRSRAIQVAAALIIALPFEIMAYLLISNQGNWINTYHVQILPFIAEPFSIFLFYQAFLDLPKEFDEAAYVDGASNFRIYWQIVVPLSTPIFATLAILKSLQFWSFYLWPLLVVRDMQYRPLMTGMDFFKGLQPDWGAMMAYATLVTVPVLVVFILFQKWFIQSVASSGVKG